MASSIITTCAGMLHICVWLVKCWRHTLLTSCQPTLQISLYISYLYTDWKTCVIRWALYFIEVPRVICIESTRHGMSCNARSACCAVNVANRRGLGDCREKNKWENHFHTRKFFWWSKWRFTTSLRWHQCVIILNFELIDKLKNRRYIASELRILSLNWCRYL